MQNGFIKNLDLLEETYKVNDLLDFSVARIDLKEKIDNVDRNSIFGLIGDFGCGKSTLLDNIANKAKADELWINFDAWKFPERNELWEGFILEVAQKFGKHKAIVKKIDGKEIKSKIFDLATDVLSGISDNLEGINVVDKFVYIFKKSPAKRVFEVQEIFKYLINEIDKKYKKIYFIVEDIDRSGDKGIFFLETLKYFLSENNFEGRIVHAIIPIAKDNYINENASASYRKVLDFSKILTLNDVDFINFIEQLFDESFFCQQKDSNWCKHINFILQYVAKKYHLTIRDIKHVIRNANLAFNNFDDEKRSKFDIRVFLVFSFLEFLKHEGQLDRSDRYIVNMNNKISLSTDLAWEKSVLYMIGLNSIKKKQSPPNSFYFEKHDDSILPLVFSDMCMIPNQYLDINIF
ncbi:hypothetical protein KAI92_01980 [Candidatus Parcubacteria bacterium]|nr:hypothetical protein [Candidatus Parcubacteria bacterium]